MSKDALNPFFGTGRFNNLHLFFESNEFITTDKYQQLCTDHFEELMYIKRDFVFRSGSFRDLDYKSVLADRNRYMGKTIVLGHSDIATSRGQALILKLLGVQAVFSTNAYSFRGFLYSLPLGLTNDSADSALHGIFGNQTHLLRASEISEFPRYFQPEFFVNFTPENNKGVRKQLLNQVNRLPRQFRVIQEIPEFSDSARIQYLRNCRTSSFVLCPEGNGVDTHRLWETLYMGGIPIVKKNPMITPLVEGLPVVQVDSWHQIENIEFLEKEWQRLELLQWDKNRLKISYWHNLILRSFGG